MSINQIVATAGDGKLLDGSESSIEFRTFLSQVRSENLADYADYCLSSKFSKGGIVLQDVVNELGRRLDYQVTNGRYQGTAADIGNDGLWKSSEGHQLLIEVKTTDAFRVSLDRIAQYRDRLIEKEDITGTNSILLVVGREDTGELEAQIRGSRHAWDMRVISIDSLVHLVKLKESTEEPITGSKIRSILVPMEYTRLDALIDVMFTAAKDVETIKETDHLPAGVNDDDEASRWEFTDPKIIEAKRLEILDTFGRERDVKLIRKTRALYWTADHTVRAVCTISKHHPGITKYWYAYHPQWDEFLGEGTEGFFILGGVDLDIAFAIPVKVIRPRLKDLNTTPKDGKVYWHIKIIEQEPNKHALQMRSGNHLSLKEYAFRVNPS